LAVQRYRAHGLSDAVQAVASAAWLWRHPQQQAELLEQPVWSRCILRDASADPLVHASHRHFLIAGLSGSQRIDCARVHFAHEARHFDGRYHERVYCGEGLTLWRHEAEGAAFSITLCSPHAQRHEGLLSLVLRQAGRPLHQIALAWVDAALFGEPALSGPMMLATRSQSFGVGSAHRRAFDQAFPSNAPAYFCLAAAQSLAALQGQHVMAGIRQESQIAFEEGHAAGFKRSYDAFWEQFGGVALPHHAYQLAVPAEIRPLSEVPSRHRARARARRRNWEDIGLQTCRALEPYGLRSSGIRPASPALAA
jgi:uncharacterized protein VirK/YbjX